MLTVALALLTVLLLVALGVVALFWRANSLTVAEQAALIRHQCERIDGYRAELDALSAELDAVSAELDAVSITGPPIDTRTGSHDRLPINDHNRQMLTDYCEGMWQHTNGDVK